MPKVYSEQQVMAAMVAAEREHPPPFPGMLSKQVSRIADVFGAMVFQRAASFEVADPELADLIDHFLGRDQHVVKGLA